MKEQLELDIKQQAPKANKVLAVLLLGEPVTTRDIVNYIYKRTGVKFHVNNVSSMLSTWKRTPLGEFITTTTDGLKNTLTFQDHNFKSVSEAIAWSKANKTGKPKKVTEAKATTQHIEYTPNYSPVLGQTASFGLDSLIQLCLEKGQSIDISIKIGKKE